jgi:hypothetical protein
MQAGKSRHALVMRTRSLDPPAAILPSNRHHKRSRASTIKASDFPLPGLGRRTRSGTVTQRAFSIAADANIALPIPSSDAVVDAQVDMQLEAAAETEKSKVKGKDAMRTRSGTVTQRKMSLSRAERAMPVLESPEPEELVPTAKDSKTSAGKRSGTVTPPPADELSDDELLLKGPEDGDYWVLCRGSGEMGVGRIMEDESDDELNLFNAGEPW